MIVKETSMIGLVVLEQNKFCDDRGEFMEVYNHERFGEILSSPNEFVQDNLSRSKKNVFRGLHFQVPPMAQAKLVQVLAGKVIDIVVDLRTDSETYGEQFTIELSGKDNLQLYIPRGFAHGFFSLEEDSIFHYKCDNYYSKEHEKTITWTSDKPTMDIPETDWIISNKDELGMALADFVSPF